MAGDLISMSCIMNMMTAILRASNVTRKHTARTHHQIITQGSRLLNLPRELRDEILSYLLLEPADVLLVYFPECKRRYGYVVKVRPKNTFGRSRWGVGRAPGLEVSGTTDNYLHLMRLVLCSRQISDEAQEMFFCRNSFVLFRPSWIAHVPVMHRRWISRMTVWCRPSLGESGVIWLLAVIEKTKERPGWKVMWQLYRDGDFSDHDVEALKKKLLPWTQRCGKSLSRKMKDRSEMMNLNAIVDVLSGPPMCKRMDVTIFPGCKPVWSSQPTQSAAEYHMKGTLKSLLSTLMQRCR